MEKTILRENDPRIKSSMIEGFLIKDTENYSNTQKSLSFKILQAEEKVNEARNRALEIEQRLDAARREYDEYVKSVESTEAPSPLAMISFARKKKKLLADAEKKLDDETEILLHNLDLAKNELRISRRRLQELINKLEASGISWNELKRILMEKIAKGFFEQNELHKPKHKERKSQISEKAIKQATEQLRLKQKKKKSDGTSEGGRTFKEKNLIGKHDYYKLKGLTDEELKEYEELLKHMLYDDEDCIDPQTAWLIRFALLEDKQRRLRTIALNSSNVALYNGVFSYFMRDGGMNYQRDFERLYKGQGMDSYRRTFFHEKAHRLMAMSGFSERFISRNCRIYAKELETLFSKPSQIKYILNKVSKNLVDEELISKEFEYEVKREIERRLAMKKNLQQSSAAMSLGKR